MIETPRLTLRAWRDEDRDDLSAMNQDPRVMAYFGSLLTPEETDRMIGRMVALQAERGFCFWAIERREDKALLGICGLKIGPEGTPIAGEMEIGWRFRVDAWGQGYARESAEASLAFAWANLDCPAVYAITVPSNERSWGLMERLGMRRLPELDFEHPIMPEGHPLRLHITYRIDRPQ